MRIILAVTAVTLIALPARAEFILRQSPPPGMPLAAPAEVPQVPRRQGPVAPRAEGFGVDVPLIVAAQQIVPADKGILVELGDGVNPDATVVWNGGRPWPTVMREALKPHGYKLVQTDNIAKITR